MSQVYNWLSLVEVEKPFCFLLEVHGSVEKDKHSEAPRIIMNGISNPTAGVHGQS